jgi:hypothetical protein
LKYDLERLKERISEYPLDKKQADKLKTLLKKIKDKECAELIGDIEKSIKVKEGE